MTSPRPEHAAPLAPIPSGGVFFRRVNFVLITQALIAVLTLAINVLLFRYLGASGKGEYTLFVLTTTIGSGISTFGVGLANVYFLGKERYPLPLLLAGSEFMVALVTLLGAAGIGVLLILGVGDFSGTLSLWLYVLTVPLVLQFAHLVPVLQARHQFGVINLASVCIPGGTLAGIGLLHAVDGLTVGRTIGVWAGSFAVANLIAASGIGWRAFVEAFPFRPRREVLGAQIRFGLQAEVGNLLQLVNYRFDQFVVAAYGGAADVGVYSIAVAVAESLWLISTAIAVVLTPRLTGSTGAEAADFAPFVCRTVLWFNGMLALAIAVVSPVLIVWVFGADAESSVAPTLWLLPGAVAMSGGLMLSSYVFSRGRPILTTLSTAVTVVVTLVLDLVFIPRFGIEGAAAASSVAYIATFALLLYWYRRLSGRSVWTAVVLRGSDIVTYMTLSRDMVVRARRGFARGGGS